MMVTQQRSAGGAGAIADKLGLLKFPDNGLELDAAALLLLQHLARGDAVLARQLLQLGAEDSLKALLASRPAELHNLLSTTLALLTSGSVSTSMACLPQAPTHPSGRGGPGWAAGLLAPHRPTAPLSGCSSLSLRSSTDSQPCPAKRGSRHTGQVPSQLLEGPPPAPHSQHCSAWTVGEGAPPSFPHTLTPAPGYDQHRHVSGGQGPQPQAAQPPLPVNRPLDIEFASATLMLTPGPHSSHPPSLPHTRPGSAAHYSGVMGTALPCGPPSHSSHSTPCHVRASSCDSLAQPRGAPGPGSAASHPWRRSVTPSITPCATPHGSTSLQLHGALPPNAPHHDQGHRAAGMRGGGGGGSSQAAGRQRPEGGAVSGPSLADLQASLGGDAECDWLLAPVAVGEADQQVLVEVVVRLRLLAEPDRVVGPALQPLLLDLRDLSCQAILKPHAMLSRLATAAPQELRSALRVDFPPEVLLQQEGLMRDAALGHGGWGAGVPSGCNVTTLAVALALKLFPLLRDPAMHAPLLPVVEVLVQLLLARRPPGGGGAGGRHGMEAGGRAAEEAQG
ncbi:hypothetical protein QJQ45_029382, partial [Haematococcus lacustris]